MKKVGNMILVPKIQTFSEICSFVILTDFFIGNRKLVQSFMLKGIGIEVIFSGIKPIPKTPAIATKDFP